MKYFFSSPENSEKILDEYKVENYLLSFAVDAKAAHKFKGKNVIIDSGAFSVWNKGGTIDINKYLDFCKSCPQDWWFINLDVIPKTGSNAEDIEICCQQGYENFLFLKKHLKKVMPVYHYGDDIKWLHKFIELSEYIGISPANDTHEKIKREFLKSVFEVTKSNVKTHGLGYSSFEGLTMFPFYSVDSISWKRYQIKIDRQKIGMLKCKALRFLERIRIKEFLELEKNITHIWEKRGVIWQ